MYKISIIIPVYNAEDFLEDTISSVINQTLGFENIELILVDDCSSDNSKNIIQTFSAEYPNVKPIFLEKNNGWPSIPRNIGIDNASAPYLVFIDSDDFILKDYCETLYEVITKEDADIVNSKLASKFDDEIYISSDFSKEYIKLEDKLSAPLNMCGNIFKTELIRKNNIRCPNATAEDTNFSVQAYSKAKKMFQLPHYYGYCYNVNVDEKSITHNIKSDTIGKTIEGYKLIDQYLEENHLDKSSVFNIRITYLILSFFKFYGSKNDKLKMLKEINAFEKYLDYPISVNSRIMGFVNNLIMGEKYNLVVVLGWFAGLFYKQPKLRNWVYFKFFGMKKLKINNR